MSASFLSAVKGRHSFYQLTSPISLTPRSRRRESTSSLWFSTRSLKKADLICSRVTDITVQDAVNRRIETAELMQALCGYREIASRYRLRVAQLPRALFKEESPEVGPLAPAVRRSACSVLETNLGATKNRWVLFAALRR
ncbi:hypothetical protein DL95DRAFT_479822 [Leptodontidium sp. 2 PMI_412]|nr:hypothetical protein DL95DRAFT_479822 [Leptodontidium sp. 2 PMI_412]